MWPTVNINALTSSGEGVGTLPSGLKVFVEGALPEEKVAIEITTQKKNYAKGRLIEIIDPSPERTEPICPYFGECGGCQIMHLHYPGQLKLKQRRVIDAFERIGHFENLIIHPCLPSPDSLAYRNKIQLPIVWDGKKKKMGLYRKHTHEVIPITTCAIQSLPGDQLMQQIIQTLDNPSVRYLLIRHAHFSDETLIVFVTDGRATKELTAYAESLIRTHPTIKGIVENINQSKDNVILGPKTHTLTGHPYIFEKLLGITFKISPQAFFQVNSAQAEQLYTLALDLAELKPSDTLLDAYCGVGALALLGASRVKHAFGTECNPQAIADARENTTLNEIPNVFFQQGRAEDLIHQFDQLDALFLNPPRKGCDEKMLYTLLKQLPKKIIYISCDPATLARDLKILSQKYSIQTVRPIDMFPQTMHVETIASLKSLK